MQALITGAKGQIGPATDFNVTGAESIRQGEQQAGEVSLSAPVKPLVVSLEDVSGAKRRISDRVSRADVAGWMVRAATNIQFNHRSVGITERTRTQEEVSLEVVERG